MSKKPVIVTFKLFPDRDNDLIEFLSSIGAREKSAYIRLAIRNQFIARIDSNMGCLTPQPDMARPPGKPSVIVSPKGDTLSDDDLEARLGRW